MLYWNGNKYSKFIGNDKYERYKVSWRTGENGDWWDAVKKYNNHPTHKETYQKEIHKMYDEAKPAKPENYEDKE